MKSNKLKYFIGNNGFSSKEKCKNYAKEKIYRLGCCEIDKKHSEFSFFENLIKNHSYSNSKIGVGILYFFIQHNKTNKGSFETGFKRIDGSKDTFSWNHCCNFKETTNNENLTNSMRTAIKEEVIKYKKKNLLICNLCSNQDEIYQKYHVDHDNPSFHELKTNFLDENKGQLPKLFGKDVESGNLTCFLDDDEMFKNQWINYHNKLCKFQILCQKCNLSKGKG